MAKRTERVTCSACNGAGQVDTLVEQPDGSYRTERRTCTNCNGSGSVYKEVED